MTNLVREACATDALIVAPDIAKAAVVVSDVATDAAAEAATVETLRVLEV